MTVAGTAPYSYQWYQGISGDTSSPVGSNSNFYTTPALTTAGSYWVRVINSCGMANSTTATIAVTQFATRRIKLFLRARPPF